MYIVLRCVHEDGRPAQGLVRSTSSICAGGRYSQQMKIACIDDLLTMKHSAGRDKDKLDIAALEKIKRGEDPNE